MVGKTMEINAHGFMKSRNRGNRSRSYLFSQINQILSNSVSQANFALSGWLDVGGKGEGWGSEAVVLNFFKIFNQSRILIQFHTHTEMKRS